MPTAIKVENLSKAYQLGQFSTGTLSRDLHRWWASIRGKEDPFLKIGETNDRAKKGSSNVVWSLRDINLEIEQGDAVGIIGRNGAGKSTLLKILSQVTSPTTGKVKIRGRIASLLEVGTGFHPELTGKENIFLNGAILGMRKREIARKFDEIVDFAGVERYIETPVKRYSSGMYVRLAFAVAAHLESEILIVDEVLAVGDAEFQKKCLGKMGDISKGEGRTVLFVSHNLSSVKQLCSQGIYLSQGAVNLVGTSKEAVEEYLKGTAEEDRITHAKFEGKQCPGSDIVDLLEYSLKSLRNEIISSFNVYEKVKIEIIYRIKKAGTKSYPNLHFFNQSDQYLFVSSSSYEMAGSATGIYKTSFFIDPFTLNTGIYKVGLAITSYPGTDVQFFINPAITLRVEENDLSLRNSPYSGPIPGDFRLQLQHHTEPA